MINELQYLFSRSIKIAVGSVLPEIFILRFELVFKLK